MDVVVVEVDEVGTVVVVVVVGAGGASYTGRSRNRVITTAA